MLLTKGGSSFPRSLWMSLKTGDWILSARTGKYRQIIHADRNLGLHKFQSEQSGVGYTYYGLGDRYMFRPIPSSRYFPRESEVHLRQITIEERYKVLNSRIYWSYRVQGTRQWTTQLTSYRNIPNLTLNWAEVNN